MALSKDDWIHAALLAIAEGGIRAVAVEPLASRLGTTKGSFYWHFSNRDALLSEVLAFWEGIATDVIIARLDPVNDPHERLRLLMVAAMDDQDPTLPADLALVASGNDPLVGPVLDRVQRKRLAFLERCFRDMGLPPAQCRHRARLAYSAYLGWFELSRAQADEPPSPRELAGYQRTVIDLLTRAPRT